MNWPSSSDPFYVWNSTENLDRKDYYSVYYVPTVRYDGSNLGDLFDFSTNDEFYAFLRSTLDSLIAVPSLIRIDVDQYRTEDSVFVNFDVVASESISGGLYLYLFVTEATVGVVGGEDYHYPMRDIFPDSDGDLIYLLNHDSLHFDWKYAIPDSGINPDSIINNIVVQRRNNRKILQGYGGLVPYVSTPVEDCDVPLRFALDPNVPNPFNPQTSICYYLERSSPVRLSIYTSSGRLVTDLVSGGRSEGTHSVVWDGRDRFGRDVGSGVYCCRLDTGGQSITRKMVLLR